MNTSKHMKFQKKIRALLFPHTQRINNVDILENLSDSDADVGVDAVKSDVAAGPGQPAGSPTVRQRAIKTGLRSS